VHVIPEFLAGYSGEKNKAMSFPNVLVGNPEKKMRYYYVYILASKKNGTLYIGVTNNLVRRVIEHKEKLVKGFTYNYNVDKLVYYEVFVSINLAIERETVMKKWNR
jgi:putative endonuclease